MKTPFRLADRLLRALVPPTTAAASCYPYEVCAIDPSCRDTGHRWHIYSGRCAWSWGGCCVPGQG